MSRVYDYVLFDCETDGLDYTKLHCVAVLPMVGTKAWYRRPRLFTKEEHFTRWAERHTDKNTRWVAHNACGFDFHVINDLTGVFLTEDQIIDTSVLSKLKNYNRYGTHSLKEIAESLGSYKGDYTGGWEDYSKEMGEYCVQDVRALFTIFDDTFDVLAYKDAVKLEHQTAFICHDMHKNGFRFNKKKAKELLNDVEHEMSLLDLEMQKVWPPELVDDRTIKYRVNKDGTPNAAMVKSMASAPSWVRRGDEVVLKRWQTFNPGSAKQRVEKLWECGWKPYDKTKGHIVHLRKARTEGHTAEWKAKADEYNFYGWKVNEDNLKTLPPSAPPVAGTLAQWLTLEGRRSSLQEWLNCTSDSRVPDSVRIHGKFWHIGAWTQRMAHSAPNQANIPAISDATPTTPVEHIKAKYDPHLRALFEADDDSYLVGCDADGIQLRVLAHYMQSPTYRDAILSGDKSLGTDIHSVNRNALGPICKSRDDAKTFIYAWLLGAGVDKIASILGCSRSQATDAINNFLTSLPELKRLKQVDIPAMAAKGGFVGLDGRFVPCNSEHLMLAGLLQSGEAIIMKQANVFWRNRLDNMKLKYKQVDFVHDEWQTVVYGSEQMAERVGKIQAACINQAGKQLGMFCPVSGSYRIGKNWKETH